MSPAPSPCWSLISLNELVDIEIQHGGLEVIALGALYGALHVGAQAGAVQRTGQRVVIAETLDLLPGVAQFDAVIQDAVQGFVLQVAPHQEVPRPQLPVALAGGFAAFRQ
jgi:hypothetical protein